MSNSLTQCSPLVLFILSLTHTLHLSISLSAPMLSLSSVFLSHIPVLQSIHMHYVCHTRIPTRLTNIHSSSHAHIHSLMHTHSSIHTHTHGLPYTHSSAPSCAHSHIYTHTLPHTHSSSHTFPPSHIIFSTHTQSSSHMLFILPLAHTYADT